MIYIFVVDVEGNVCVVIVFNGMGNGDLVDGFGFMLNNIFGEEDVNLYGVVDWLFNMCLVLMMCLILIEMLDGDLIVFGLGGFSCICLVVFQIIVWICMGGEGIGKVVEVLCLYIESGYLDVEVLFLESDLN